MTTQQPRPPARKSLGTGSGRLLGKAAKPARKAMSLRRDGIFKLLVMMTSLLGWVVALGCGTLLVLQNIYGDWQLERQSKISIYLLPESPAAEVQALDDSLSQLPGVVDVSQLPPPQVRALLAPYFQDESAFPLPLVLEATVRPSLNRETFDARIQSAFPAAEIDDARDLLAKVARSVRVGQVGSAVLALTRVGILGILVVLTVRAGMRSQHRTLHMLQYMGAADGFLIHLITRQVLVRTLFGWLAAAACAVALTALVALVWPVVRPYLAINVWLGLILAPLILPLMAGFTAHITARQVLLEQGA